MREVYEIRATIEGLSAARTVSRLVPADFVELERLLDALVEAATKDDPKAIAEADLAFHAYVNRRSEHRVLVRLFQLLEAQILRCAHMTRNLTGAYPPARARAEHQALIDALRTGHPKAASEAFRNHVSWDIIEGRLGRDASPHQGTPTVGARVADQSSDRPLGGGLT
ncbi:GntR family transcriptional regulator [Geochorda subterranea]|uniref:GntR family transcriptional regulator n=1 Tax=Geochorda subterranea TaxID=3109564 RepID=UPI0038602BB9